MARSATKPITEVNLTALQDQYLSDRSHRNYQNLFAELLPYARSLTLKKLKSTVYLPPELVDSYALDATLKFMEQYKNPGFKVDLSFAGLLNLKVLESMYGPKVVAADQIGSLNEHIENGRSGSTEMGELSETFGFTYMFQPNSGDIQNDPATYLFNREEDAVKSVLTVIHDLYMSVSLHCYMLVCFGLLQFLKKKKTYDRFRDTFLDDKKKEVLDMCIMEIYNRLQNVA